jgi:protein-disulfide isomerase
MSTPRPPITPHDHVRGTPDSAVTLVEYGDYECPHCGAAHPQVKLVERQFAKLLRFAFRHFPLSQAHPLAELAAECAETAAAYGSFWHMHEALYENQEQLGLPLFFGLARTLAIPEIEVSNALATKKYAPKIRSDFLSGVRSGVNGTPTFFINGVRHDGSYLFEDLAGAIDAHLYAGAALWRGGVDARPDGERNSNDSGRSKDLPVGRSLRHGRPR